MKECLHCKTNFEPTKPKQKFCSAKCKTYWHRQKKAEGDLIWNAAEKGASILLTPKEILINPSNKEIKMATDRVSTPKVKLQNLSKTTDVKSDKNVVVNTPHKLWKAGDPKEGSGAFYLKYECQSYSELEKLKK